MSDNGDDGRAGAGAQEEPEPQRHKEIDGHEEPEPQRHTGHLIRRAQQRHLALWQEYVSSEISSVQYAVLAILDRSPGASQSDLGLELGLDRSTIADLVARMVRHGLIERESHPSDRRRYSLRLTEVGRGEVDRLRPLVHTVNANLTGGMTADEVSSLRALLKRLVASDDLRLPGSTHGSLP